MYWSMWHEIHCDNCKSSNFVSAGDPRDMTGYDPVRVRCWSCGHVNKIDDEDFCEEEDEDGYEPHADDGVHFERVDDTKRSVNKGLKSE